MPEEKINKPENQQEFQINIVTMRQDLGEKQIPKEIVHSQLSKSPKTKTKSFSKKTIIWLIIILLLIGIGAGIYLAKEPILARIKKIQFPFTSKEEKEVPLENIPTISVQLPSVSTSATPTVPATVPLNLPTSTTPTPVLLAQEINQVELLLATPTAYSAFQLVIRDGKKTNYSIGSLRALKIIHQQKIFPAKTLLSYILNPSYDKTAQQRFSSLLEDEYYLINYQAKKQLAYLTLIVKIKNSTETEEILKDWAKNSLADDLRILFFDKKEAGQPVSKVLADHYQDLSYSKIAFQNDYALIWAVWRDYLIVSTHQSAFERVIDIIKR